MLTKTPRALLPAALVAFSTLATTQATQASAGTPWELATSPHALEAPAMPERPIASAAVATPTGVNSASRHTDHPKESSSPELASVAAPTPLPHPLRRLRQQEITRAVVLEARRIIHEHHDEPFGTEIPFTADDLPYVARIERHYHPPGGEKRPWGYHPGVSVFVARPLETE